MKNDKDSSSVTLSNTTPREDRRTRGKAIRTAIPLQSHAGWKIQEDRPDPLQLLKESDKGRIPELIPIRYGRMLKSPFAFCRGSAAIMASDLANTPRTKINVQVCGDCHAVNFGVFATPERNVVFDINDFDETLPGPWEWDLKRLAASLVLISRNNGFKSKHESAITEAMVKAYRLKMETHSHMSILDIWYAKVEWENVIAQVDNDMKKNLKDDLKKAQKNTIQKHYFPKMTHEQNGRYLINDHPPLIYHVKDNDKFIKKMTKGLKLYCTSLQEDKQNLYDRYQLTDIAIKVVGVGSVGTTCAVALLLAPDDEPLFLQIKEARASVLETYIGKSTQKNHGQRVVAGQRIIQSASDIFLGWMELKDGRDFYVRQLRDTKIKLTPEQWEESHLISMSEIMGEVLARAHARSGDPVTISGYLGDSNEFDLAIADFAIQYADQIEKDYAAFVAAVKSGHIKAEIEAAD